MAAICQCGTSVEVQWERGRRCPECGTRVYLQAESPPVEVLEVEAAEGQGQVEPAPSGSSSPASPIQRVSLDPKQWRREIASEANVFAMSRGMWFSSLLLLVLVLIASAKSQTQGVALFLLVYAVLQGLAGYGLYTQQRWGQILALNLFAASLLLKLDTLVDTTFVGLGGLIWTGWLIWALASASPVFSAEYRRELAEAGHTRPSLGRNPLFWGFLVMELAGFCVLGLFIYAA